MLASYELYHRRDPAAASRQIEAAMARVDVAGERTALAELLYLQGEVALFDGRLAQAESLFRRSRAIDLEYFPVDFGGTASLVETLAAQGDFAAAQAELDALASTLQQVGPRRTPHPRITLAYAYLLTLRDGAEAAAAELARRGFTRALAATSIVGTYRLDRLEALAVRVGEG